MAQLAMAFDPDYTNVKKDDRELVVRPIEGKTPLASSGLLDPRVFSGEGNTLHAVKDQFDGLWKLKYVHGLIPMELRQKFTTFSKLYDFVQFYLRKRNLQIVEVID